MVLSEVKTVTSTSTPTTSRTNTVSEDKITEAVSQFASLGGIL